MSELETLAKQIKIARRNYETALATQARLQEKVKVAGKRVNAAADALNQAREAFMQAGEAGPYALYLGAG